MPFNNSKMDINKSPLVKSLFIQDFTFGSNPTPPVIDAMITETGSQMITESGITMITE